MLKEVKFHRFKQYRDHSFSLNPNGVTLIAGGNNSGKSSILHGLAVWQFCRTALEMEKGTDAFVAGRTMQGLGLGDDEFSPINVPSLKHLWTNLKSRKETEQDGYTLKICCSWSYDDTNYHLEFGLALANDRLFVKTIKSNLAPDTRIPNIAYLPPFAGITDRETRQAGAIRRRRIGEGLAGAVLRNLLLDMYEHNVAERARLRADRAKIRDSDLRALRENDPWELLQTTLRETFSAELLMSPFKEEYHSYIRADVIKGKYNRGQFRRISDYNKRDLMVEGSGFLQWLSVYALAVDPNVDVLLLDEPDAHLHISLQEHLLDKLRSLAEIKGKQVFVATHSTEILRNSPPARVFELRNGRGRYLSTEDQKVGLLAGLGSNYAPKIDRIKNTNRLLLVEGRSDVRILRTLANKCNVDWPEAWVEWTSSKGHKDRKHLYLALKEEIPDLVAISLRDRDDEPLGSVGADLIDKSHRPSGDFHCLKWRRRYLESYLIWPPAIALASGLTEDEIDEKLREQFGIAIPRDTFTQSDVPEALFDLRGKAILKEGPEAILGQLNADVIDVANAIDPEAVCEDIRTFLTRLTELT